MKQPAKKTSSPSPLPGAGQPITGASFSADDGRIRVEFASGSYSFQVKDSQAPDSNQDLPKLIGKKITGLTDAGVESAGTNKGEPLSKISFDDHSSYLLYSNTRS